MQKIVAIISALFVSAQALELEGGRSTMWRLSNRIIKDDVEFVYCKFALAKENKRNMRVKAQVIGTQMATADNVVGDLTLLLGFTRFRKDTETMQVTLSKAKWRPERCESVESATQIGQWQQTSRFPTGAVEWSETIDSATLNLFTDEALAGTDSMRRSLFLEFEIQNTADPSVDWDKLGCCELRRTFKNSVARAYNRIFAYAGIAYPPSLADQITPCTRVRAFELVTDTITVTSKYDTAIDTGAPDIFISPYICGESATKTCTVVSTPQGYAGGDLCSTITDPSTSTDIMFDTVTGAWKWASYDIATYIPGDYVIRIDINAQGETASVTVNAELIDPCPTAVLAETATEFTGNFIFEMGALAPTTLTYNSQTALTTDSVVSCGDLMIAFIDGSDQSSLEAPLNGIFSVDANDPAAVVVSMSTADPSLAGTDYVMTPKYYFSNYPDNFIMSALGGFTLQVIDPCNPHDLSYTQPTLDATAQPAETATQATESSWNITPFTVTPASCASRVTYAYDGSDPDVGAAFTLSADGTFTFNEANTIGDLAGVLHTLSFTATMEQLTAAGTVEVTVFSLL